MYDQTDLEIFVRIVRTGSLTRAGAELGLSVAVISKRLRRLETRLATRLMHRTTRHLVPTDLGHAFFDRIAPLIDAVADAEAALSQGVDNPRGTLRVTVPTSFGRLHVVPHLGGFFARYPDIALDLSSSDDFEPIVERGFDLAIRIGALKSSGLTARKLAPVRRILCAAPSYLAAHGRPETLEALAHHVCLGTVNQDPWHLTGPGGACTIPVAGPLRTRSNEVVRAAVIAGLGIALRSTWDIQDELASGRLEPILPAYAGAGALGIHAVYPSRSFLPGKTRAFIEFLRARLRRLAV